MQTETHPTLAELAVTYPAASRVFHRLKLDYCCHGRRPLEEACRERGLDPGNVLAAIREEAATETGNRPWRDRPLPVLVDFIESRYHRALREELPELVALAGKVERRHADKDDCPRGLTDHLRRVHQEVLDHLEKEEQVLFPMILAGRGSQTAGPVLALEHDHRDHALNLARTRELTGDLEPPAEACTSWRALYLRLEELERDLMEHIHLENNVLFPRALNE